METGQSLADRAACCWADGTSFPTLRQLGLDDAEIDALRSKGYLTQDKRGRGLAGYWRLRFRFERRTRTVYLGRDERLVAQVRKELGALQNQLSLRRQCMHVTAEGSRQLRAVKVRLAPVLRQLGFHYHGDTIRKFRGDAKIAK